MDKYGKIKSEFERLGDPQKAVEMSAYMRNQFKFYGLPTLLRRSVYKKFISEEKKTRAIDWDFLNQCWSDEHREFQYLVMDYLAAFQSVLTYDDVAAVEKFARSRQWWDSIDGLDTIIGNIGLTDKRMDSLMLKWSTDTDFWIRRIAIDHQLCRRGRTDTALLEKIIVNNFGSDEFFINKAIGWSLREYSKTNPDWVRDFLNRYSDRMAPLSIREAGKYVRRLLSDTF